MLDQQRPGFVIHLRPTDGDGIRALRALLKIAWRRFRLKAVLVEEVVEKGRDT
jgi:hypothetical protein